MGVIVFRTREFGGALSETAGYKSGLGLDEIRLRGFVEDGGCSELWPIEDTLMRVRSEDFEEIFAYVLHRLGIGPATYDPTVLVAVWHDVKGDPERRELFKPVADAFVAWLGTAVGEVDAASGPVDPHPFVADVACSQGPTAALLALDMVERAAVRLNNSPYSVARSVNWADTRDLDELFRSERLEGPHGTYFDQRFVNFLAANFESIDKINWRQFEGLAGEYFARAGFAVELGPGRGDGGVDVRLWPTEEGAEGMPAAVLVQCKRQKAKISNTVVKALWADVHAEGAGSGLIVTTSSFAPSAENVRTARDYPVAEAGRPALRSWIAEMRTPGTGFFMAE
jgi:restriction system protein